MRLELGNFPVADASFGDRTALEGQHLIIDKAALLAEMGVDPGLGEVEVSIVKPGESARIVHVLDVVEPRVKVEGPGCVFPGLLGQPEQVGSGRTHRLQGVAVISTGRFSQYADHPWFSNWEAIIDMAGAGAELSPYASLINVVVSFQPAPDVPDRDYDAVVRMATLRATAYLAETCRNLTPASIDIFDLSERPARGLPPVAFICHLGTLEELYDSYIYGYSVARCLPTAIHPNELLDGAVVSSHYRAACERHPTYLQQNNPIVLDLFRRHGRELDFRGVILQRNLCYSAEEKIRNANYSAKLARMLGAEGVIITRQGGGHSIADAMITCSRCERQGLRTALVLNEFSDTAGADVGYIDFVPEATAVVSTGNQVGLIKLPAVERVIGGTHIRTRKMFLSQEFAPPPLPAEGPLEVTLVTLMGCTDQLGATRLRAVPA